MTSFLQRITLLLGISLLPMTIAYSAPNHACDTDFTISTQVFCEQDNLDQINGQMKEQYLRLLELLQQSQEFYTQKYQDAYYDNFEMPYDVVKEELVKSQILWQQYVDNECQVVRKMRARGNTKEILELQCLQDYAQKRLKTLKDYIEEVRLDATSLLKMPL